MGIVGGIVEITSNLLLNFETFVRCQHSAVKCSHNTSYETSSCKSSRVGLDSAELVAGCADHYHRGAMMGSGGHPACSGTLL